MSSLHGSAFRSRQSQATLTRLRRGTRDDEPKMNLKNIDNHFQFGQNWQSYVQIVDEEKIEEAVRGLRKLLPEEKIRGKVFLDIGCGSGLSMLAALRLGAARAVGIDLDPASVNAANLLLSRYAPGQDWNVSACSVFDADPATFGQFDIVHSWGVLHHTGQMWEAISHAGRLVRSNGLLVLALYHKTPLCRIWTTEKRIYTQSGPLVRGAIRGLYKALYLLRIVFSGKNPRKFIASYKSLRGMDWHHDVHDWLGGYPYESVLPLEVETFLKAEGFVFETVLENCAGGIGVFGTGCDEFVARKIA